MIQHLPVLVREVLRLLAPSEGGIYIDATVGLGGHAEEMLKVLGSSGRLIGIDRDENALQKTAERLKDPRLVLKRGRFSDMGALAASLGITQVDGILLDLGVSMMQLRDLERGFSFTSQARLDMRMDRSLPFSAWDVVNTCSEADLARIIREYGEEFRAQRIARAIVRERQRRLIDTGEELAAVVQRSIGRSGRTHPATRTFQAIRIEVNRELEELQAGLDASLRLLKKGGRFCVISYHSLEDRLVKHYIRERAREGLLQPLIKKPVVPGEAELRENPSSRSAKLRGAERL